MKVMNWQTWQIVKYLYPLVVDHDTWHSGLFVCHIELCFSHQAMRRVSGSKVPPPLALLSHHQVAVSQSFEFPSDNIRFLRHGPAGFFNVDFDGGEPVAPLPIIAIADSNQLLAITFEGLLCAFLTGVNVSRACISVPPDRWRKPRLIEERSGL